MGLPVADATRVGRRSWRSKASSPRRRGSSSGKSASAYGRASSARARSRPSSGGSSRPRTSGRGASTPRRWRRGPTARPLGRDGKRCVGPTSAYAWMRAMGLVNDHRAGCHRREAVAAARAAFTSFGR
ncbi:MAG: DNA-3-methyladenine glycosylase I [Alphaproteobacteria bacterium]